MYQSLTDKDVEAIHCNLIDTFRCLVKMQQLKQDGKHQGYNPYGLTDVIIHAFTPIQLSSEILIWIETMLDVMEESLEEESNHAESNE
jgi:hypothetical protein